MTGTTLPSPGSRAAILCGTDLGPSGARAADVAAMLARALDLDVCLVHAASVPREIDANVGAGTHVAAEVLTARVAARHDEATRALELEQRRLAAAGTRVPSARVVEGRPSEVVVRETESLSARFAVIGPHARARPIRDSLLGSTADAVVRHAPCPVVVATGAGLLVELAGRDIVVGVDGEPPSLAALRSALALAAGARARVHAVCAASEPPAIEAIHAAARTVEREVGGTLSWTAGQGSPANVILDTASARGAALIALGTHGRSGLPRAVLGSVAEDVARRATVPVMVCRAP